MGKLALIFNTRKGRRSILVVVAIFTMIGCGLVKKVDFVETQEKVTQLEEGNTKLLSRVDYLEAKIKVLEEKLEDKEVKGEYCGMINHVGNPVSSEVCFKIDEALYKLKKEAPSTDVKMLIAIMHQETGGSFNPKSLGRAKEIGLMQIHPKYWCKKGYCSSFKCRTEDLWDIEQNIKAGNYVYSLGLEQTGSKFGALKRYNGSAKYAKSVLRIYGRMD